MLNLLICFLALKLCIPVDLAPEPNILSPVVRHATYFGDSVGVHACYEGRYLWETKVGDLVIFNNRLYQVKMADVFPESTYAGRGYDLFVFTCYSPEWENVCFIDRNYVWDRFVIGMEDITDTFRIHP